MSLEDRVAIVTGAGNGIGRAIAVGLAQAGARVVAADIDAGAAKLTADAVSGFGHRSLALKADVGDLTSIDQMVHRAVEAFEQIDILVNATTSTSTPSVRAPQSPPSPREISAPRPGGRAHR